MKKKVESNQLEKSDFSVIKHLVSRSFFLSFLLFYMCFVFIQEILEAKCEPTEEIVAGEEEGVLSVNSLRRSISQVIDGKSLAGDDDVWDPNISAHDSGMVRDPKNVC